MEGLLEIFGKFDSDGDGVFEFNEFCKLWEHLGFEQPIAHAAQPDSDSSERDPEFDKFDLNADGVLSARGAATFCLLHICLVFVPSPWSGCALITAATWVCRDHGVHGGA